MRLSNAACLKLIRRTLAQVLMPELKTDGAQDAGRVLMRTLDELVMREQAPVTRLGSDLIIAIQKTGELVEGARELGLATAAHTTRLDVLAQRAASLASSPGFAAIHRDWIEILDEVAAAAVGGEKADAAPAALALARDIVTLEAAFEQSMLDVAAASLDVVEQTTVLGPQDLLEFLQSSLKDPELRISEFERIPGGMSKRTYRFTAESPRFGRQLLIARETAGLPHGDFDAWFMSSEFELVRALSQLGFAVPEALYLNAERSYYVMRRSPGSRNTSIFTVTTEIPRSVLLGMAEFLARLHTTPLEKFGRYLQASQNEVVLQENLPQCIRRTLLRWHAYSKRMGRLPSPAEYLAFTWLMQNIPANTARPSLLHGDFGPHNCLWDGDRLTAVLDWEGSAFGDPAFDLGYARASISGRMNWQEFLDHYERCGGPRMSAARVEYFDRFSMYRTLITTNQAVARAERGEKMDLFLLNVDFEYWPAFIKQSLGTSN